MSALLIAWGWGMESHWDTSDPAHRHTVCSARARTHIHTHNLAHALFTRKHKRRRS
jgi:hypothetical protein